MCFPIKKVATLFKEPGIVRRLVRVAQNEVRHEPSISGPASGLEVSSARCPLLTSCHTTCVSTVRRFNYKF